MRRLGKIGFVGVGGGCKGAVSVGMMKALAEANIFPDYAYGVSVNVLNLSALIASGIDSLIQSWMEIEKKGYNALFNRNEIPTRLWKNGIFSHKNVGKLATAVNAPKLIASPVRLEFPLHNESQKAKRIIYSNHDEQFKENPELIKRYILAATCMPGFIEPVNTNNEWFSDGLYFTLEPAIAFGCETIFVFFNDFHDETIVKNPAQEKWYHRLLSAYDTVADELVKLYIEKSLEQHKDFLIFESGSGVPIFSYLYGVFAAASQGDISLVPHRIVPIAPTKTIPELNALGFGKKSISVAIEHGYDRGREILDKLLK